MDRSLDEIISERPRGGRGRGGRRPAPPRGPRREREEYPRDGVRKNRIEDRPNIDTDWVHDRFEDDRYDSRRRDSPEYGDSHDAPRGNGRVDNSSGESTKLRIDNLHYELAEGEIRELFARIGPLVSFRLLYDRADRSQGTAFATFTNARHAREAIREYDGANAHGQPIRITIVPAGPPRGTGGSLFDRVERPSRSLFERIENSAGRGGRRGGRARSHSPRNERVEEDTGRYPERRASRSPRRRGGPRDRGGRRPGARRQENGRGGGRQPRSDDSGRPSAGGRPRKTAEELDAEMADYFGKSAEGTDGAAAAEKSSNNTANADHDIDMIS